MLEPPASLKPCFATPHAAGIRCWRIDLEALAAQCPGHACAGWPASAWLHAEELSRLQAFPMRKRRIEWLGGRLAGKQALRVLQAHRRSPGTEAAREWHIRNGEDGRPVFAGKAVHLSISHGRRIAMAAVGEVPVGIDVEGFDALRARSLDTLLWPSEVRVMRRALGALPTEARAFLWCLKEALFKAFGQNGFARFACALRLRDWHGPDRPVWQAMAPWPALDDAGQDTGALARQANGWRALCHQDAGAAHVLVTPALPGLAPPACPPR
ncbi:4'-phosphopantetheinyl transferase family protein [Cupriavidus sp. PET2-C1]